ncbi:rhodanese-like domain-containing protein [Saccharothrix syringae]|uniref:Rhodanese-like domain-containing protein n=1 Tax=Saccharothrix syringae TaxID=103733 RepID=A0A5Q0GR07_SACSY|nr:rhodanese-like domain-containing protein [Saccharothrix syringae]QFZ16125.1 rhodanese-like domain-containing protein [Saccharothrix syringae]
MFPVTVPSVEVSEVPARLPDGKVLLDVREPDEWAAGHAPGALHIPMSELAGRLGELPADADLYVVCRAGGRSARVVQYLNANGWDATNVDGGMQVWAAQGRPLVAEVDGAEPEVI